MKKRVAVVLPYFGIGGAETMVSRLVSHIDLSAVSVEVICIYGKPLGNILEKAILDHGVRIKYIGKGLGFSPAAVLRLWKELSAYKPNVVHTHLSACVYCMPWILFHKQVMLHTVHSIPENELIKLKQIPMRFMYKLGKAVPVAISEEIKNRMISFYKLKTTPEVISNPVDVKRFAIDRQSHDHISIVTAGRLSKEKNQRFLIEVAGELYNEGEDIRLTILGDGPLKDELSSYVKESGLDEIVTLTGKVDNLEEYFALADIFALCSIYEGVPLVILEAMAASLPIISTDVGGIKDVLGDGGLFIPSGDKYAYKENLRALIHDEAMRAELGVKSHANVGDFDSSVIAGKYVDIYNKYSK